jgi:homoserine kinase
VTLPLRVRAPATTANLGPAFDCAGVALDLWNELALEEGDGEPDRHHLGVRAFALLAPHDGLRFSFTDRIPRARGLGSSAAVIALGLVAGALVAGRDLDPEALLAVGIELEGHGDNLAAALAGGVCLTWETRIARVADGVPAVPIAVVPEPSARAGRRCSARRSPADRRSSSARRSPIACTSPTEPRRRRSSPLSASAYRPARWARRYRAQARP